MKWDSAAAQTAIKTCLAFGLAMAAALYLNWDVTPTVITVQVLQQALLGIAVRNSITRFLATCSAGFISLLMLGFFPQDRFMLVLTYAIVVTFAVYMFQHSRNPKFWVIFSIIIPFIGLATGGNPLETFNQAVAVTSAFMLGGVAVILVNELVWPSPVTRVFEGALVEILQRIQKHFDLRRAALVEGETSHAADQQKIQAELLKSATMLPTLVRGAAYESRQIEQFKNNYKHLVDDVRVMCAEMIAMGDLLAACMGSETLGMQLSGSQSFKESLDRFVAELDSLAGQVKAERDGSLQIGAVPPPDLSSGLDTSTLSYMDRALLQALRAKASEVWSLIGAVRQALANVENRKAPAVEALEPPKSEPFSFTSYRFKWSLIVGIATFFGTYLWLVPNWPGGLKIAIFVPVFGCMMVEPWPGQKKAILTGLFLAMGISWILFFIVLPQLPNDFWFLWPAMMIFFFPLVYMQATKNPFWAQAGLIGGLVFCMLNGVSHNQQFSFSSFIDSVTGLVGAMVYALAFYGVLQHKPAENEFLKTIEAFFGLSESTLREFEDLAGEPDAINQLRTRRHALIGAYQQCAGLVNRLPYKKVPQNDPQKVGALLEALWSMTFRMNSMLRERIHRTADGSLTADQGAAARGALAAALMALRNAAQRRERLDESLLDITRHPEFSESMPALRSGAESEGVPAEAAGVRLAMTGLHRALLEEVETTRQQFNLLDWKAWDLDRF